MQALQRLSPVPLSVFTLGPDLSIEDRAYPYDKPTQKNTTVLQSITFRGRRRQEPLPETTPNMAATRGSHFVTRVTKNFLFNSHPGVRTYVMKMAGVCEIVMLRDVGDLLTKTYLHA